LLCVVFIMKNMNKVKEALITIANQNKKEDLKENKSYWDDVISDIKNTADKSALKEITENDFGFDSFEQVMESVLNYT
jgi:hypothetical protein